MAMIKFLRFNSLIVAVILISFNLCFVLGVSKRNPRNVCLHYNKFSRNYEKILSSLIMVNKNITEEIKIDEPIIRNFESKKATYPENKIYEMSDPRYTRIGFDNHPLYKTYPFMKIAFKMLLNNGGVLDGIRTARICYEKLVNSVNKFHELKTLNIKSENFLKSKEEMYQFLINNLSSKCWGTSEREPYMSLLDNEEQSISEAQNFIDEQERLLKLQYDCTIDPINEIIRLSPLQSQLIETFYQSMETALGPHFAEIKRKLKNTVDEYELLVTYQGESDKQINTLNSIKLSDYAVTNADEATNLFQKAEDLLKSMGSYISNDLSTSLNNYINKLKENEEIGKNIDSSIKINEKIIPVILSDIEELKRLIQPKIQVLTNYTPTASDFISKIDENQYQSNQKEFVLARATLDKEIDKFFEDCHHCHDYGYKSEHFNIHKLASQIKSKISQLLLAETQIKKLKEDYASRYDENKAALETLFSDNIPKFERKINEQAINQHIRIQNPTERLNLIELNKNKWVNDLTSIEQQVSNSQLSSINGEIEQLAALLDQLSTNNNKLQRQFSSHESSIIETKAEDVISALSRFIESGKTEIESMNPKVKTLDSLVENIKATIKEAHQEMDKISNMSDKIRSDYTLVHRTREDLSNQLSMRPNELRALLTNGIKDLNMDIETEISNLEKQKIQFEASANSLRDKLRELVEGIDDLTSRKQHLGAKVNNLNSFHTNLVESLTSGLDLVETFDFPSSSRLFKKTDETLKDLLTTLKKYKDDKIENKQYYNKSVKNAENLIEKIEKTNENNNFKNLLANDLSPETIFLSFKTLYEEYSQSLSPIESKLESFRGQYDQLNNDFDKHKNIYETLIRDIFSLFSNYNEIKSDGLYFNDEEKTNNLIRINKQLNEKYTLSKSTTDSLKNSDDSISQLDDSINNEVLKQMNDIEKKLESLNSLKESHKNYYGNLEKINVVVEKTREHKEKLTEKKEILTSFQKSVETKYTKIKESIKTSEEKLTESGESQTKQIENLKTSLNDKFKHLTQGHEDLKNRAENSQTDLPTDLNNKYYGIIEKKGEIDSKYNEQIKIVTEELTKGMTHYENEKEQLQNKSSQFTLESEGLITEIESLINSLMNMRSFEGSKVEDLDNNCHKIEAKIDDFVAKNNKNPEFKKYNEELNILMPVDILSIENELKLLISSEKSFLSTLKSSDTKTKPKAMVDISGTETNLEESDFESKVDAVESDAEMYSAVEGVAQSVSSKDYFKLITAIGTIAVICLIIGAATLRYKGNKKREIYNKCENIYVHA